MQMTEQPAIEMALRRHAHLALSPHVPKQAAESGTFRASGGLRGFIGAKEHSASSSLSLALRCCSSIALFLLLASARRFALPLSSWSCSRKKHISG